MNVLLRWGTSLFGVSQSKIIPVAPAHGESLYALADRNEIDTDESKSKRMYMREVGQAFMIVAFLVAVGVSAFFAYTGLRLKEVHVFQKHLDSTMKLLEKVRHCNMYHTLYTS
jgi:hypothetical protein